MPAVGITETFFAYNNLKNLLRGYSMYYDQYQPYYQVHSDPELFASEVMQEQEWERMASFYTDVSGRILDAVRKACQRLDYEGSWIYDEYPNPQTVMRLVGVIRKETQECRGNDIEIQSGDFLDDLIRVLLLQEIARRRCKNHRCRFQENHRPPNHRKPDRRPPVR